MTDFELLKIHNITPRKAPLKTVTFTRLLPKSHEEPITISIEDYAGVEPYLGYSLLHIKFFDGKRDSILIKEDYQTVAKMIQGVLDETRATVQR